MRVNNDKVDKGSSFSTVDEIIEQYENVDLLHGKLAISELLDVRITLIDKNYEVIHTSENSEKIIGYSFDDFKLLETFGYIHPDDRAKVIAMFKKFNEMGISEHIYYRIFRPSGEMCWIKGMAKQLLDKKTKKQKGIILFEFDFSYALSIANQKPINDESQYKVFLETIRVPILFMKNNAMVWATKIWSKFFGINLEELKNKSLEILFTSQDDYAKFLLECNQKLKTDGQLTYHTSLNTRDNKSSKVDIYAYTIEDNNLAKGILFFFLDVTEIEELLYIKDQLIGYYRSIMNNSEAAIIRIENQKIMWYNKATEDIFQYNKDELINNDFSVLFQTKEGTKRLISEINKKILANRNLVGEIQCIRKDRYPISLAIRVIPITYQKTNEFFIYLEPVSEIKQLANQLREEKGELEYYSDLLFHDVKNYCQDALSQIDLSILKMDKSPDEAKQRQRKSQIEILRIAELINNMDKFFRIKRRGYELQAYDVYLAIEKAKSKITSKFDNRTIVIDHNLSPQKHLTLGNELLQDVFLNLLDNIVIHDNNPEVLINIKIDTSEEKDDYWSIEFNCNSSLKGLDFDKYLDSKVTKIDGSVYSSGFGLTLAKSIVESLNGSIKLSDEIKDEQKCSIVIDIPKQTASE
ncbi:MAG: PAS domain S-box protein [Asgard group archaeon]|nr:PAS domain S-box protein [Asgard group archaeon]